MRIIPKLRFKAFNNVWNVVSLNKVFNKIKNAYVGTVKRYYTDSKNGHFYLESNNIKNGRINKNTQLFVNDKFYNSQEKNWLHTGDIVMVQSGAVGDTAVIPKNLNNTAAHAVIVISHPNRRINSYFFNDEFQSEYFKREIYKIATGNTIVHVLSSNIKKSIVKVPSLPEQQLIGKFFAKLDKLIQLQQKKVSLLKKLKQGYLQKLFPRKGESVPRLRFKGFHDEWKSTEIKNLGKILTGNTPTKSNENNYSNRGLLWITPTDINSRYIINTKSKISRLGEKHARIVPANSILITCIASIGKNALTSTKSSFNQQINALVPKSQMNYYFLYVLSYYWSRYMQRIAPKGAMSIINKRTFSNIQTKITLYDEQYHIGKFFKSLDNLIQYQINMYNYLHKLKKAYLQKMFC